MINRRDRKQIKIFENNRQFVINIDDDNRWVRLSRLLPWDKIEEHYAKNMSEVRGREGMSSRVAFGAILVKEQLNLTDAETVNQINENVYLQYFLGQTEYNQKPLFDPSMMVHFRKRFTNEFIEKVNEYICLGKWSDNDDNSGESPDDNAHEYSKQESEHSETEIPEQIIKQSEQTTQKYPEDNSDEDECKIENRGKLLLDATVAPSDIRYPSDVSLLDECREALEKLIDILWEHSKREGHKTPYNRHSAHKKTIHFIKKKNKNKRTIESALNAQLTYVEMAIRQLLALIIACGLNKLSESEWDKYDLICRIYLQQKQMFDDKTNRCEDKIMSLRQPHVRAIARNKARAKYEYGQKLALSIVNGFAFIEKQSWDNFNEGGTLIQSVENYYRRFGFYPVCILADQIYRTRANIAYCKSKNIRLSGPRLGRKTEEQKLEETKQAYKDSCERNAVEGANGVLKRRYGLDLIMCVLQHNAEIEASLQILAMNLQRRLRLLFDYLWFIMHNYEFLRSHAFFQ